MAHLGRFVRDFLTPTLVLILGGVVVYDHLVLDEPTGGHLIVNGKVLGRKFASSVVATLGDGWATAADILEQGKTVADAQSALQTKWQEGRIHAFTTQISPEFTKILPEGIEPTDPAQRAAVVKLWRDFATGLKGGR